MFPIVSRPPSQKHIGIMSIWFNINKWQVDKWRGDLFTTIPGFESEDEEEKERPQERGLRKQKARMFHFPPV